MDEGLLNDSLGHKVSFKNTVVIMTSNVGARLISKGKSLGFVNQADTQRDYTQMKDTVMEEVKRVFNPEFINRIDEIVVFHPLTEAHMEKILELMLKRVEFKLKSQNFKLALTKPAKEFLVKTGFDPNYGARPLLRTIQRILEDPLAEELLNKTSPAGATINVGFDESSKKITFDTKK